MHDEVGVRMRHRVTYLEKESKPLVNGQSIRLGVLIDPRAVDELQDEVRLARRRDARVEQPRDVLMRKPREQRSFASESRCR